MRIVGKTVEQDDGKAGRLAALVIADLENARADRFDGGRRGRLRPSPLLGRSRDETRRALDEASPIHRE
jgi:hypothetical protein